MRIKAVPFSHHEVAILIEMNTDHFNLSLHKYVPDIDWFHTHTNTHTHTRTHTHTHTHTL